MAQDDAAFGAPGEEPTPTPAAAPPITSDFMSSVMARLARQDEVQKTTNDQIAALVAALTAPDGQTSRSQQIRRRLFNTNPTATGADHVSDDSEPNEALLADALPAGRSFLQPTRRLACRLDPHRRRHTRLDPPVKLPSRSANTRVWVWFYGAGETNDYGSKVEAFFNQRESELVISILTDGAGEAPVSIRRFRLDPPVKLTESRPLLRKSVDPELLIHARTSKVQAFYPKGDLSVGLESNSWWVSNKMKQQWPFLSLPTSTSTFPTKITNSSTSKTSGGDREEQSIILSRFYLFTRARPVKFMISS
ncbi:LOW QUALITY PROTEIN: hypothetical protein YC2023_118782 [Brassica napus]